MRVSQIGVPLTLFSLFKIIMSVISTPEVTKEETLTTTTVT